MPPAWPTFAASRRCSGMVTSPVRRSCRSVSALTATFAGRRVEVGRVADGGAERLVVSSPRSRRRTRARMPRRCRGRRSSGRRRARAGACPESAARQPVGREVAQCRQAARGRRAPRSSGGTGCRPAASGSTSRATSSVPVRPSNGGSGW